MKKKIINKEKVTKAVVFILVTHIIYLKLHNERLNEIECEKNLYSSS